MQILNFSTCWNNKLLCMYYTTIRLTDKYNIGETVEIHMNKKFVRYAKIQDKKVISNIEKLTDFTCYLNTGYSREETINLLKTMYKNSNVNWETQPIYIYLINDNLPKTEKYKTADAGHTN